MDGAESLGEYGTSLSEHYVPWQERTLIKSLTSFLPRNGPRLSDPAIDWIHLTPGFPITPPKHSRISALNRMSQI